MPDLIRSLVQTVGAQHVLVDQQDTAPYLTDWRGRYSGAALAVVKPACTAEVAAVVQACAAAGIAIVPQGGNTGLCGGATPLSDGKSVVLNLSRMSRVRDIDPLNNTLVVEAGCTLAAVHEAAGGVDRLFPLSLASEGSCQIGGNISTNAGGVHVLRYGNMRDLVLGVEVVLPDGRVWDGLRALRKDNTGYDLKQLFIGAEGTLGIVTAAVLKLFASPRVKTAAWVAVGSPAAAVELLGRLRARCGDRIAAFEIIGEAALELVLKHVPGSRAPLEQASAWAVLVELADTDPTADINSLLEAELALALDEDLAVDAVIAASGAQHAALWALRENISEAQRIEGISIKHDISVPVSRIPEFLELAGRRLMAAWPGVRIVVFGHIGDGNLHYNLSKPDALDNAAFIATTPEVNRVVHDLVVELGGSISAEHGLGQLKRAEIMRYKSSLEFEMMRSVKACFDPRGLMNPGKLL